MKFTNFSFKDIGVFHLDEQRVRQALKDYYASGNITSFGRNASVNTEKGDAAKSSIGMGTLAGGRIATHVVRACVLVMVLVKVSAIASVIASDVVQCPVSVCHAMLMATNPPPLRP